MKAYPVNLILALGGGVALASMIAVNSQLAVYSSPLLASWVAHGIGAVTSLAVLMLINGLVDAKQSVLLPSKKPFKTPIWAYFGGIPGALTVILAAVTVNSPLGLSGSIAFIMAGQVLFGVVSDTFGLFGLTKRPMTFRDCFALMLMAAGCLLTLFGRG